MSPTWNSAEDRQPPAKPPRSKTLRPKTLRSRTPRPRAWHCRHVLSAALLATATFAAPHAGAWELWSDEYGDRYIDLNPALKSVLLAGDQPAPLEGAAGTNFWRMRLDLAMVPEPWLKAEIAYEQRLVIEANPAPLGSGGQLLPPTGQFPYQVISLGDVIVDDGDLLYEHNFDRMSLALRKDWGQIKIGRQAIGFGRSMFFTALDVLSPFGTFQVDQEWRAGVDALHTTVQVADTASVGLTAAAEEGFEDGAILGRVQGFWGTFDGVLLGGKRSEDWMIGVAGSTPVFDAAMSLELAYFQTDGQGVPDPQIGDEGVIKGTLGGTYTFDLLSGLTLVSEYHFNGFGLSDVRDDATALLDDDWNARFQRGDFQTLGQHELATSLSLVVDESLSAMTYAVVSPVDGSGMVAVGGTWDHSTNVAVDLNAFIPWGSGLDVTGGVPSIGSEYGTSPLTLYLALRLYD